MNIKMRVGCGHTDITPLNQNVAN